MDFTLEQKLTRIIGCSGALPVEEATKRSLLHAYVACLSFSELCQSVAATIASPIDVRLAIRGRLLRLIREDPPPDHPDLLADLVERTLPLSRQNAQLRKAVDALHSAIFEYLPMPAKHVILNGWIDRGTRECAARWLKATRTSLDFFDPLVALAYWRSTGDSRAAKSLAYQASPEFLSQTLPELVTRCQEGWIISKAALRASVIEENVWFDIRSKHPATYAYLCARTGRGMDAEEAFSLVCECSGSATDESRGLAIWAVGQLGLIEVLDRIAEIAPALFECDKAEFKKRFEHLEPL